eukprot:310562_1
MTADKEYIVQNISDIIAVFSVISSLWTILACSYSLKHIPQPKHVLKFVFKTVLCVAVSDLFYLISKLMGSNQSGHWLCQLQSVINQIGSLGSVLSTLTISITIHFCLIRSVPMNDLNLDAYFSKYLIILVSLVFISTILPFATNSHNSTGEYCNCWLKDDYSFWDHFWKVFTFHIPLWVSIVYMLFVYYKIYNMWTNIKSNNMRVKMLFAYPMILTMCFTPATIRRMYEMISGNVAPFWLITCHILCAVLLGILDGVIFTWSIWKSKEINIFSLHCLQYESIEGEQGENSEIDMHMTGINVTDESTTSTKYDNPHKTSEQHNKLLFDIIEI